VQISQPGTVRLVEVPEPVPEPGEAVVRVGACGICGTDLHILDGEFPPAPYPIIPGHEAAGTVVVVGGEGVLAVGDRVGIDPSLSCRHCEYCRMGRGNLCSYWGAVGDTRDGALAEYVRVPMENLYRIPDTMDFHAAALIEPVSCAIHGLDRLGLRLGDDVLVCGAGTMGLIMASLIRHAGAARVAVVDTNEDRLRHASRMGFVDAAVRVGDLAGAGSGFDKAVDATGAPPAIAQCLESVRRGGTVMVFGVAPAGAQIPIEPFRIYNEEITIVGSMAVLDSYGRAIQTVASGVVDASALVTHRLPLVEIDEALRVARRGEGLKVQITPANS
jgi:2-desacetyl-2-hydroxyethyl bacteriochlorophyllide A dehydrogenase